MLEGINEATRRIVDLSPNFSSGGKPSTGLVAKNRQIHGFLPNEQVAVRTDFTHCVT
jgi:hypothetical protein